MSGASSPEGNYHHLTVNRIVKETQDSVTISFAQGKDKIVYKSGQFLTLVVPVEGIERMRSYSLSTSPYFDADLAVTVKRVKGGIVSNWLCDHLSEGDPLKVMDPTGNFAFDFSGEHRYHYVLFAGGSGITPMLSIIKSILVKERDSICSLIYCNKDAESIIFKNKLQCLERAFVGKLKTFHVLGNPPDNWDGHSGRLSKDVLDQIWKEMPGYGTSDSRYLMCGPEGFIQTTQSLLEQKAIPSNRIFRESFTPLFVSNAGMLAKKTRVRISNGGEWSEVIMKEDVPILDAALNAGINLPSSCRNGLCTACKCKMLIGEVKMEGITGLSKQRREEGYILPCIARPLSSEITLEF